jgi:excisionase family DNA binding protein
MQNLYLAIADHLHFQFSTVGRQDEARRDFIQSRVSQSLLLRDVSGNNVGAHQTMNEKSRIPIPEIAKRLGIGRLAVYTMLEQGIIPGVRIGRRWIVTQPAYEHWELTCGTNHNNSAPVLVSPRVH